MIAHFFDRLVLQMRKVITKQKLCRPKPINALITHLIAWDPLIRVTMDLNLTRSVLWIRLTLVATAVLLKDKDYYSEIVYLLIIFNRAAAILLFKWRSTAPLYLESTRSQMRPKSKKLMHPRLPNKRTYKEIYSHLKIWKNLIMMTFLNQLKILTI